MEDGRGRGRGGVLVDEDDVGVELDGLGEERAGDAASHDDHPVPGGVPSTTAPAPAAVAQVAVADSGVAGDGGGPDGDAALQRAVSFHLSLPFSDAVCVFPAPTDRGGGRGGGRGGRRKDKREDRATQPPLSPRVYREARP
ncbi:hypothetical protein BHE74_00036303 [Ensete ventricosum]|nr:hypothetical protein BHE74_00036303 [Ensete ventricosum]RZS22000.1 hypothetical protein BHM03_00054719 [Ensete ventricosum]